MESEFSWPNAILQVVVTAMTIAGALLVAKFQAMWASALSDRRDADLSAQLLGQIRIDFETVQEAAFAASQELKLVVDQVETGDSESQFLLPTLERCKIAVPKFVQNAPEYAIHLRVAVLRHASDICLAADRVNSRLTILEQLSDTASGVSGRALAPYVDDIRESADQLEQICKRAALDLRGSSDAQVGHEMGT